MVEAAIQLEVITPEEAKALVEKGQTLSEWMTERESVQMGKPREGKKRKSDRLWLFALLLFNLAAWAAFGWILLRVLSLL